jgi:hypothetical protein
MIAKMIICSAKSRLSLLNLSVCSTDSINEEKNDGQNDEKDDRKNEVRFEVMHGDSFESTQNKKNLIEAERPSLIFEKCNQHVQNLNERRSLILETNFESINDDPKKDKKLNRVATSCPPPSRQMVSS